MLEAFRLGGWPMMPTALFGLLLLGVSVRFALDPQRRWIPLQIALAILTLSMGALGFVAGVMKSATAMGGLDPGHSLQILAIGVGESLHDLGLALTMLVLAAMALCIGAVRGQRTA